MPLVLNEIGFIDAVLFVRRSAGIHEKYLAQIERKIHQMQHISA